MTGVSLHTVCAWCGRVRAAGGEWREAEAKEPAGPRTTHGICPDCLERATARATMAVTASG